MKNKRDALHHALSREQRRLRKKHGTPAEFATACYAACPGYISMDEARIAIEKYNRQWNAAALLPEGPAREGRCK